MRVDAQGRGRTGRRRRTGACIAPALLAALAAMACGRQADAGEGDAARVPASQEGRVAYAPTGAEELPAAVLGSARAPQGTTVRYFDADTATRGYLAVPAGRGPFPAVILIHEWDGVTERIRQVADAMAAEGYVALAADLYSGRTGSSPEENRALTQEVMQRPDRVVANLDAAARWLRARPDVTGRIATIGWCFGGGVALSYAIGGENHEGTAIFYGRLIDDPARLRAITHPIYGTFAAEDRGIPPEQVRRFVAALREAGIENDVHIYDDVGHGFWLYVDEDPETRRAPALDAWRRLKAYLERTLG